MAFSIEISLLKITPSIGVTHVPMSNFSPIRCLWYASFQPRADGSGDAGGAIAPPIIFEIRKKVAFSTPNISRLQE